MINPIAIRWVADRTRKPSPGDCELPLDAFAKDVAL